ncbi:MAG: UDP-N-acetylmuramate--L-alanine ligase [Methylacidiphilales bacterium]|nr:UDP-N-acetylmuramate--L-alanine ligase [Candidatus Methylacidiphilales bacterium]MDW8349794.1 UDP-N-acetylmuramate--L-alanine ligase [Verrucomicrobiae bacterium]
MMNSAIRETLLELLTRKRSHFALLGVGGAGMSALARILLQMGHFVYGVDRARPRVVDKLIEIGMAFHQGHDGYLPEKCDAVIYSSAIEPENAERQEAQRRGLMEVRRGECVAVLASLRKACLVAGMHGKTTTASMLAHVLREAGPGCAHYIGAEVPILGSNAEWAAGADHFVVEVDESDGTLAEFSCDYGILLNIEEEHLDYYRNLEAILSVFKTYVQATRRRLIYCGDDRNAVLLCSQHAHTLSYGFSPNCRIRAQQVKLRNYGSTFTIYDQEECIGEVQLNVPGLQNVSNATAVVALARELGLEWDRVKAALAEFQGARRRFEVKYQSRRWMVVDDYAHHPTEIRATLAAAKNSGWKRVLTLFQPHRYSRTKLLQREFATAFKESDVTLITEVYGASEKPLEGVGGARLAWKIKEGSGGEVIYAENLSRLRAYAAEKIQEGDLILTLGAGDIHKTASELARELELYDAITDLLRHPESEVRRGESLARHTTLRVGGPAQIWVEPGDEADLRALLQYLKAKGEPFWVIGRGSNLLVKDGGLRGVVIHLGKPYFKGIRLDGQDGLIAGAGARLKEVVAFAKRHLIGGLEFLDGIPGSVGGALKMNAGAMGHWTMDSVSWVRCMDKAGNVKIMSVAELSPRYREVPGMADLIALEARFIGKPSSREAIEQTLQEMNEKRWKSQPAAASAGCIFKNPPNIPAGKLIDELGCKGWSVGDAVVSQEHGNFIINRGQATAADVLALIERIREAARERAQVNLENEVIVLGEDWEEGG